jgi:hypothetical protein
VVPEIAVPAPADTIEMPVSPGPTTDMLETFAAPFDTMPNLKPRMLPPKTRPPPRVMPVSISPGANVESPQIV